MQLYPMNPLLYYNRGLILYESRKFDAARLDFEKAVQLNPKYEVARDMLTRIKS